MTPLRIFLGWDSREGAAFGVAIKSLTARVSPSVTVRPVSMVHLGATYHRPTTRRNGRWFDVISEAPMATQHAIARFFVPKLCAYRGWALFADGDILVRADIADLFALRDAQRAVMVVKHQHQPTEATKMDGQAQTAYPRKNWSSVMLWNCQHPAHRALDDLLNTAPGRDLHRFCWLDDTEIGTLPQEWNHLVGVNAPNPDAKLAHFTLGTPDMPRHDSCEFADEWRAVRRPQWRLPPRASSDTRTR